jgi:hypothetical protein
LAGALTCEPKLAVTGKLAVSGLLSVSQGAVRLASRRRSLIDGGGWSCRIQVLSQTERLSAKADTAHLHSELARIVRAPRVGRAIE